MRIKKGGGVGSQKAWRVFASIFSLVVLILVGVAGLKVWAESKIGDFTSDIKTDFSIIDKNEDRTEKKDYYSGETVILSSRMEFTSEGESKTYPGAYFLLKFPKEHASTRPTFNVISPELKEQINQDSDSDYIQRFNYSKLEAGTIHSVISRYKLDSPGTAPEGYKPEIIFELYSADGNLLSRQVKSFNNKLAENRADVDSLSGYYGDNYIAQYTDESATAVDKSSYPKMGIISFSMWSYLRGSRGNLGLKSVKEIVWEFEVPEYMILHQDPINHHGWTFDKSTRIAKKVFSNFPSNGGVYSDIKMTYTPETDDSILGSRVKHTFKATYLFKDGTKSEKQTSRDIKVVARRVNSKDAIKISKSAIAGCRYWSNDYNINNCYVVNPYSYTTINVEGNGDGSGIPIKTITEKVSPSLVIKGVNLHGDTYSKLFSGDNSKAEIQVVLRNSLGEERVLGVLDRYRYTVDLIDYNSSSPEKNNLGSELIFKFPEGYVLPEEFKGNYLYSFKYKVSYEFKDKGAFRESLSSDNPTTISTESIMDIGQELKASATIGYVRPALNVLNSIKNMNSGPYLDGESINIVHAFAYYNLNNNPKRAMYYLRPGMNYIKNPRVLILYDPSFNLSERALDKVKSGEYEFHFNYKNTGKSALGFDISGLEAQSNLLDNTFIVSEITKSGQHEFELVTYWDDSDQDYYGTEGLDDLDFDNNGKSSRNVARSKMTVNIIKPEFVGINKYVRSTNSNFKASVSKLDAGQEIEYNISIINSSESSLDYSRVLDVLPRIGDKKIVEGVDGTQEDRGSTTNVFLTGPIEEREGFTILYSTEDPGADQNSSWNKNFVSKDQITDWSSVRMIRIQQNQGYQISPRDIIEFIVKAKIDDNASDLAVANNSVAVAIYDNGNLVESDPVSAQVEYPVKIQGVAFIDKNANSLYDAEADQLLPGYQVEILKGSTVVAKLTTDSRGYYSYSTKDHGSYSVKFTKTDLIDRDAKIVPVRDRSNAKPNGSTPTSMNGGIATTAAFQINNSMPNKLVDKNIGVYIPLGNVKVEHRYTKNKNGGVPYPNLFKEEVVTSNARIGTQYDVRDKKLQEITVDNLVYSLESVKGSETGAVTEGDTVIVYQYKPKLGGAVKAKFVDEQNQELKTEVEVKPSETQVGVEYSISKDAEITKDNLVYVFKRLANGSMSESGRVSTSEQTVTFVYTPKLGGIVKAKFVDEQGNELSGEKVVSQANTQVGTEYRAIKEAELVKGNLTYVFKQLKNGSASESGRVSASEQIITFVYAPKEGGDVVAKFVNQDGSSIKADEVIKANKTQVGTQYASTYPNEITTQDGITYVFEKIVDGSAPQEGRVSISSQVITYRYIPKKGGVVVAEFISKTGEKLKADEVVKAINTPVGTSYVAQKQIELTKDNLVYVFESLKTGSAPESGKVSVDTQTITFIYAPKVGGNVEARFVDENGIEIKETATVQAKNTQVGTSYSSTPATELTYQGIVYVYKKLGTNSAPQTGHVTVDAQTITFVYAPKRGGAVIANFVDESGNSLKDTQIVKADGTSVGTPYQIQEDTELEKDKLVYSFKELKSDSKPKAGRVSESTTEITFVYTPKPGKKVVAKFEAKDGSSLAEEDEIVADGVQVGTSYTAKHEVEIEKEGLKYIFKEMKENSAPVEGRVSDKVQEIVYVYDSKFGEAVNLRFIDENVNEIQKTEEVSKKGLQVGANYEANIPEKIKSNGRIYKFKIVRSEKGDAERTGKISEDPQTITAVYELEPLLMSPSTGVQNSGNLAVIVAMALTLTAPVVWLIRRKKTIKM